MLSAVQAGGCTCKSPLVRRANVLSLQNSSLKPNTACLNNTWWHTDADVFPEHSASRASWYYKGPPPPEDHSGFYGSPLLLTWLVWLGWLEYHPVTKRMQVQLSVQERTGGNQLMFLSHTDVTSPFLSP